MKTNNFIFAILIIMMSIIGFVACGDEGDGKIRVAATCWL